MPPLEDKARQWASWTKEKLIGSADVESPASVDPAKAAAQNDAFGETCVSGFLCLATLGLLFLVIGGGMYGAYNTNERARRRAELAGLVDTWKGTAPGKFLRSANVTVRLSTSGCSGNPTFDCPCLNYTATLKPTSNPPDEYKSSSSKVFSHYTQLRLAFNTSAANWTYPTSAPDTCLLHAHYFQGGRQFATVNSPLVQRLQTSVVGENTKCPLKISKEVLAKSMELSHCQTACEELGGTFNSISALGIGYSCIVPYALTRLCVRAMPAAGGLLVEQQQRLPGPGQGCYPVQEFSRLKGKFRFSPTDVRPMPINSTTHDLLLELRAPSDPWLHYLWLTQGQLVFKYQLNPRARRGMLLLVVGALMACLWVPLLYFGWRWLCSRHRYESPMGLGETLYDGAHKLARRMGRDLHADFAWPPNLRHIGEELKLERQAALEAKGCTKGRGKDPEAASDSASGQCGGGGGRIPVAPPVGVVSVPSNSSSAASVSSLGRGPRGVLLTVLGRGRSGSAGVVGAGAGAGAGAVQAAEGGAQARPLCVPAMQLCGCGVGGEAGGARASGPPEAHTGAPAAAGEAPVGLYTIPSGTLAPQQALEAPDAVMQRLQQGGAASPRPGTTPASPNGTAPGPRSPLSPTRHARTPRTRPVSRSRTTSPTPRSTSTSPRPPSATSARPQASRTPPHPGALAPRSYSLPGAHPSPSSSGAGTPLPGSPLLTSPPLAGGPLRSASSASIGLSPQNSGSRLRFSDSASGSQASSSHHTLSPFARLNQTLSQSWSSEIEPQAATPPSGPLSHPSFKAASLRTSHSASSAASSASGPSAQPVAGGPPMRRTRTARYVRHKVARSALTPPAASDSASEAASQQNSTSAAAAPQQPQQQQQQQPQEQQ